MIEGLDTMIFHTPVRYGRILDCRDRGTRLIIQRRDGGHKEIAISRGILNLRRPRIGDYLVEYPQGHIDVMGPEDFVSKAVAGGAGVS